MWRLPGNDCTWMYLGRFHDHVEETIMESGKYFEAPNCSSLIMPFILQQKYKRNVFHSGY
ncbi:hypothetical protein PR048_025609 [Dryococelus australis]|uniref:Uncharacterized protein n=1 Tax=Dryococelus australis TaxID=614101 RepID=A0ABQ9GRV0_9NEOP|nr:hypothetical protein PR048_025609 [Dryococelus australis]